MLNEISKYAFNTRIFILSAIFVLVDKSKIIFSKSLDSNGINQNPLLASLLIKYFGSNHPRRIKISITKINNFKKKLFKKIKILTLGDNNFKNLILEPTSLWQANLPNHKIKLQEIIFVGDSHVEFYSRIYRLNSQSSKINLKSLWLGPTTMAGFSTSHLLQKWLLETLKELQKKDLSCKNTAIIFSLGHIDIRTSLGFLISTKVVKNSEEAIEKFSSIFQNLLQSNFMKSLRLNYASVSWMAIPPPSPYDGINIKNCSKKQAMNLIRNDDFTIFGSSIERAKWTCSLNQKLNELANKYKFGYIYESSLNNLVTKKYLPIVMKLSDSFDGTHISKRNIILKIIKNFVSGA